MKRIVITLFDSAWSAKDKEISVDYFPSKEEILEAKNKKELPESEEVYITNKKLDKEVEVISIIEFETEWSRWLEQVKKRLDSKPGGPIMELSLAGSYH